MGYKLVAVDLDDTLLTSGRVMNERAKQSLERAAGQGVIVVLCTGRTKQGAQRFYDELGLNTLYIVSGGAEVLDERGDAIYKQYVDPDAAKRLLKFAYDNEVIPVVYIDGNMVFSGRNSFTDSYEKRYGFSGIVIPDLLDNHIITPKVLFYVEADRMAYIQNTAKALFPALSVVRSNANFLEFADSAVSKGTALKFVAQHYGIDSKEIIAFGDNEIDIPMLNFAGLGVAVANADPLAKQAAGLICASNDEGGIADVIDRYILEA